MRKAIDLAAAVAAAGHRQAQALTLDELVKARSSVVLSGSDTRLRKWLIAFGTDSARDITGVDSNRPRRP